jgi:hypothetical protein
MTLPEYLDWLDEYWEIFGPPPSRELMIYPDVKF